MQRKKLIFWRRTLTTLNYLQYVHSKTVHNASKRMYIRIILNLNLLLNLNLIL